MLLLSPRAPLRPPTVQPENHITSIQAGAFDGLDNLRWLSLVRARDVMSLVRLRLPIGASYGARHAPHPSQPAAQDDNQLANIQAGVFHGLKSLVVLGIVRGVRLRALPFAITPEQCGVVAMPLIPVTPHVSPISYPATPLFASRPTRGAPKPSPATHLAGQQPAHYRPRPGVQ